MKKPNFFIIGAPKCGTTAMAKWLAQHPDCFFSSRKEPHYFNTDGLRSTNRLCDYELLFEKANSSHMAVGEGSTRYLFSHEAVPNIVNYSPDAKFIVCVRNPIEIAPALHSELISQGQESEVDFNAAWSLQSEREKGFRLPSTVASDPFFLSYGKICKIGEQLERLYSVVSHSQVHVVFLDDVREAPKDQYNGVLNFLGLREYENIDFSPVNASKKTRSAALAVAIRKAAELKRKSHIKFSFGLAKTAKLINVSKGPRSEISAYMKKKLVRYFSDDIRLLSDLSGRDLSFWMK